MDAAIANMFLHHVEDPPGMIRELFRILRTGGRLIITDLDRHSFTFLAEEHFDTWMGFERKDIADWFRSAGFTDISVDCTNENCVSASKGSGQHAAISIFIAKGRKP